MIPTIGGFDQHDDFDPDRPHRAANVDTPPEAWTPRGDLVLVKRLPDKDKVGGIFIPETSRDQSKGVRRGVVVSVGPGDALLVLWCSACERATMRLKDVAAKRGYGKCSHCRHDQLTIAGRPEFRSHKHCEMNVSVGDEVLYWRVEANDVKFQGEEFVYLHEEQHVIAVLEKAS